jgi:hypothetical protein
MFINQPITISSSLEQMYTCGYLFHLPFLSLVVLTYHGNVVTCLNEVAVPCIDELTMLNPRLHEHNDFVDLFVLIEATVSNSGIPKPLFFNQTKERLFPTFLNKICHIIINTKSRGENTETYIRVSGLKQFMSRVNPRPSDILLYSDCDEIYRKSVVQSLKEGKVAVETKTWMEFRMFFYNWKCCMHFNWTKPLAINASYAQRWLHPHWERLGRPCVGSDCGSVIPNAGWHATFFFPDDAAMVHKLEHSSHRNDPQIVYSLALSPAERAQRIASCVSFWSGIPKSRKWMRTRIRTLHRLASLGYRQLTVPFDSPRFAHLNPGYNVHSLLNHTMVSSS